MDALVLEHDGDREVTGTNATGETMLGVHPDALIGRTFFERVHVADRPAYLRHCDEASRGHLPEPLDLRIRCGAAHATPLYQTFTLVARPLVPNEDRGPFIAILRRADQAAAVAPAVAMLRVPRSTPDTLQRGQVGREHGDTARDVESRQDKAGEGRGGGEKAVQGRGKAGEGSMCG